MTLSERRAEGSGWSWSLWSEGSAASGGVCVGQMLRGPPDAQLVCVPQAAVTNIPGTHSVCVMKTGWFRRQI